MKSRSILASIDDLKFRKRNPRKHNDRNLQIIEKSITKNGTARSIVADENGEILAGNGTVQAAKRAGIKKIIPVEATGEELIVVVRRGLSKAQKEDLVIADNRASDTSEWDIDLLRSAAKRISVADYFTKEEIGRLSNLATADSDDDTKANVISPAEYNHESKYMILVECKNEKEQVRMLKRLDKEGLKCRALIS